MIVRHITIGNVNVWLSIDQLRTYDVNDRNKIIELNQYVCYFKFAEPTPYVFGELIRKKNNLPVLFNSIDEAIEYAINMIRKRFGI